MNWLTRTVQVFRGRRIHGETAGRRKLGRRSSIESQSVEMLETRAMLAGEYAPDHVLLSLQPSVDKQELLSLYPGSAIKPMGNYGLYLMTLPQGVSPLAAIDQYKLRSGVNFAEPDWTITPESIPNDPRFAEQWSLQNIGQNINVSGPGVSGADIDITTPWNTSTGSTSVIVAIVDTGIEYTHPDLAANMWVNAGEIAGNGIDDDSNGYIDDVNGYDFGDSDSNPAPDPAAGNEHGTHVAGIVGAVGNNGLGVSGVNWNVSLMAVKVFSDTQNTFVSAIVDGLNYAVDNGAFVSNHSYNTGRGGPIQAHQAAVAYAQSKGHVFVASAGNTGEDNDVINHYPSDFPFDNVVAVAATDNSDGKASFSNFGPTTVHLGAPGVDILSTVTGGTYAYLDGTSMASPHVAGVVAYIKSIRPDLDYKQILAAIFAGVDPLPGLAGITITGGRVNVSNAISHLPVKPDPEPGVPTMLAPAPLLSQALPQFQWTVGANAVSYDLEVDRQDASTGAWTSYYTKTGLTSVTHTPPSQFPEATFRARARTIAASGKASAWSEYLTFTIDVPSPSVPKMVSPQGDIGTGFPQFKWDPAANVVTYNLWVTKVSTGERVIFKTNHNGTTYTHFSALKDGTYRAWVQGVNTLGERSAWSNYVEFTIDSPIPAVPVLTAPTGTTSSSNPRFIWNLVEAAASYDLWVNNVTTGKAQYLRVSDLPYDKGYYDPSVFTQGNYIVWIRAANGNGEYSAWSTGYKFTVDILPPAVPTITGPVGATGSVKLITTVNPTFTWTAVARAVRYELWVNNMTTGQYQIIRKSDITTTSFTPLANLTQGDYRVWVRAINSANEVGEWSQLYTFTIDEAVPVVPVITDPKPNPAGSVENPNPTFIWTMATKAPYYEIQIDNTTLAKTKVVTATGLTTESFTVPTAQRLGEYAYTARVRAYNASGETSDWSASFPFRIDVPNPGTPTITGPKDTITDTTPTFSWTHEKNSIRYEILVRDMVRGENIVLNVTSFQLTPSQTEALYTLPDAKALRSSTYRFWIRGFNALGQASNWSLAQAFVIAANDVPAENNDLQLAAVLESELSVFASEVIDVTPATSIRVQEEVPVEQTQAVVVVPQQVVETTMTDDGLLIDEVMSEIMLTEALMEG